MAAIINAYNSTVTRSLARVVARGGGTPEQALRTSARDTRIADA